MKMVFRQVVWLLIVCVCLLGMGSLVLANQGKVMLIQDAAAVASGPVTPSQAFHFAYQDYLKGHYDLALTEFEKFISDFPKSSMAPKAYYYMGECYEEQNNLKEAARALTTLLEQHETSRQVPAALFKLGKVMEKAGHPEKAKAYWSKLMKDHRGSPEAKLAKRSFDRIP
ncbi:MAG: tol-pal system protein YbgF [Nitrospirae bacterium]|nr:tol-pal system protein YbgF [Nitrospirota bacterium]MDA1303237.1 tol-pal system protein YbgF [Nitrospirota bacterium]